MSTEAGGDADLATYVGDEPAFLEALDSLVADKVASGIAGRENTLWGKDAESEAGKRLAWVGLAQESRDLVDEITGLRDLLADRGMTHVVLCGMGGSSLAPEVICATHGVELTVLDSSDPDYVRRALGDRLESAIVVVSSKSGGTVETDSQKRAFEKAFADADCYAPDHIVVVTDPGSPLDESAQEAGFRIFHADPEVGGRYSALTAFGLVPSGLAGADISKLLDEAAAIQPALESDDPDNPGAAARCAPRRGQRGGRGQGGLRGQRVRHPGVRRLGRAAHRRVDGQERQGHPAGRRTFPGGAELRAQHCRRGARDTRSRALRGRAAGLGLGRRGPCAAGCPDAAVGVRHRGGRVG